MLRALLRSDSVLAVATSLCLLGAFPVQAGDVEMFFVKGWVDYCRPAMERIAKKRDVPSDGEVNAGCVGYVTGITDSAFLLLISQQRQCPPKQRNREAVFLRSLQMIEKLSESDKPRAPMVSIVNRAVADQCGIATN
jgi:hypothetical protein